MNISLKKSEEKKTKDKSNQPKKTKVQKRALGHAKGLIIESTDCWIDDFEN
jgi:hypothetical protein